MYWLRILFLVIGVVACSTAALMIKEARSDALLVAAWRLLIGSALLGPLYLAARRRYPAMRLGELLRLAWPAAVLLALHFWSWNIGVRQTLIANASLVVNMVAPVMPVIIWFVAREQVQRRELVGTVVAFGGTLVLGAADLSLAPEYFVGDLLCFGSMLLFALYLAWSRRHRQTPSIWLYVVPVYLLAGVLCLGAGWAKAGLLVPTGRQEWVLLLGLAVIPTVIGHSILNQAMKQLRSQVVAVVNLGQFIPAALLAWVFFQEVPGWQFVVACTLVVGGALQVIHCQLKAAPAAAGAVARGSSPAVGKPA